MSGHSKWSTIKRKKGESDAKRGALFTKLVREITTATRLGGSELGGNPRLRAAVAAAKAQSMPGDTIERAIKKGSGQLEGPAPEDTLYEGYGVGGVALYIEAQTDNRHRTTALVRTALTKAGGNLGAAGSVGWMFRRVGQLVFAKDQIDSHQVFEHMIEAGAADIQEDDSYLVVHCDVGQFGRLLDVCEQRQYTYQDAELTMLCDNPVMVGEDIIVKNVALIEKLEELDDIQKVYANFSDDGADVVSNR